MSAKAIFLNELRAQLRKVPNNEVDDLIEYYDELISERVSGGEKESAIVKNLGEPKDIAASFKRDIVINRAVKRPTPSNSIKALVAILGVLSLPLLLPIAAVVIVLAVALIVILVACFVAFIGTVAASILAVIDMAMVVHSGDAPFYLLVLVTGGALVAVALTYQLARGVILLVRVSARMLIRWAKSRRDQGKEEQ